MATKVKYYDDKGQSYDGYNIGGKTYKDEAGTQRIDQGSYVQTGDTWWKMGDTGGEKVNTPDWAGSWIGEFRGVSQNAQPKQTQQQGFDSPYSRQINDLISAIQNYQNTQSMGRDESQARAYSQLNNLYNANLDKTLDNYNKDAISRGMFGQLPTEALKQNAISESELNKSSAINDLANSLYIQDFNMARQKDQDFYNKQNNLLNVLTQGYNIDKDIYQTQQNQQNAEKQEWINNIGQYSNDYQAEINNLMNDGDSSNDWKIAYLQNARNQKITGIGQAESKQQEQLYKQAMDMFDMLGYADGWIANTLGIPEGTTTAQYSNQLFNQRNKSSGSGGSGGNVPKEILNTFPELSVPQKIDIWQQATEIATKKEPIYNMAGMITGYETIQPSYQEIYQIYLQLATLIGNSPYEVQIDDELQKELEKEMQRRKLLEDFRSGNLPNLLDKR